MIRKQLPFYLLAVLVGCMAVATFVEKFNGTPVVQEKIYHSGWFVLLWAALVCTGSHLLFRTRKVHKAPGLLLHGSFVLILTGALVTHLTSLQGIIHLRQDAPSNYFTAQQHRFWESEPVRTPHKLPFSLTLLEFTVEMYAGTQAPADYVSKVLLSRMDGNPSQEVSISMNRILRHQGYRFYQRSYDPDQQGSLLSVNYDPYGVPLTYAGYALLVVAMIGMLLNPRGTFRQLLRHPALRGTAVFLFLVGTPVMLRAQEPAPDSIQVTATHTFRVKKKVIPPGLALQTGKLQVLYNDRVAPLQTLARDFTLKLHGKATYKGWSPEQVLCGWLFCPEQWQYEPLITIKSKELARRLETPVPAPLVAFFGPEKEYKLQSLWSEIPPEGMPAPLQKAVTETDEKVQLILMLERGSLLKLFPLRLQGEVQWYAPTDSLPAAAPVEKVRFIRGIFTLLQEAIVQEDYATAAAIVEKISLFQHKEAGETALSAQKIRAERFYNRFEPSTWLFRICLTIGVISFLFLLKQPLRRKSGVQKGLFILLVTTFLCITATIVLRTYIAGRVPQSNGYETLLFLSWLIQLFALLIGRRLPLALIFGFLLSGFTLLVSTLGQMNPQITPLMPVLLSPWLSLHVSLIMIAYALFAFTFLCGMTAVLFHFQRRSAEVERLTVVSRLLVYPANFLLGTGIFVGAVWANVSWGSYWAWDPKEVWALIAFLVYAFPMHGQSLPYFRNPLGYHLYILLAFTTLLMTYFGVNYFLGGMHSYAG